MTLSNTHIIPELKKLLKVLEDEAEYHHKIKENRFNKGYSQGIFHCIEKIREISDRSDLDMTILFKSLIVSSVSTSTINIILGYSVTASGVEKAMRKKGR